jgi:Helix-turn-helix domain
LARAAKAAEITDRRTKALAEQALDQIGAICRRVQDRVRAGEKELDLWARSIPRSYRSPENQRAPEAEKESEPIKTPLPRYRPLGDPDNLSLKEAAKILGKAHSTVYLWHRQGKLPPAVDVGTHLHVNKPVVVVARYRLEAWLAGERMPSILQDVFDHHILHEPPWGCWTHEEGRSAEGHRLLGRTTRVDDRNQQAWEADLRRGP